MATNWTDSQGWEKGHTFDRIIVSDVPNVHLGDVYVNVGVEQVGQLQELLSSLATASRSPVHYQQSISYLDALSAILLEISPLYGNAHPDDLTLLQSLRLVASVSLDYVQEQGRGLRQLFNNIQNTSTNISHGVVQLSSTTSRADEVARSIHRYLNSQLLLLNTTLQLLHKKAEDRMARHDTKYHNDLSSKADTQIQQLGALRQALRTSGSIVKENQQTLERLAERSLHQANVLSAMQHSLSRVPTLADNDSILLRDALNRSFKIPFTDFVDFEMFQVFLKQQFDPMTVPGGSSVAAGRYLIANRNNVTQVATKSSWSSMIYPGCTLIMSVILNMISLSVLQCPRPTCREVADECFQDGKFITCRKCGLRYRFDRTLLLPAAADPEENLVVRQIEDDVANFGPLVTPAETYALDPEHIDAYPHIHPVQGEHLSPQSRGSSDNSDGSICSSNFIAPKNWERGNTEVVDDVEHAETNPVGSSALQTWIDSVDTPASPQKSAVDDDFAAEVKQRQRELRDLDALQNVHFVELAPTTEKLVKSSPNFQSMPLDVQIHYRKIVDKYPSLSFVVAERLAKTNVTRSRRIERIKRENEMEAKRNLAAENITAAWPSKHRSREIQSGHTSNGNTGIHQQDIVHRPPRKRRRGVVERVVGFFKGARTGSNG